MKDVDKKRFLTTLIGVADLTGKKLSEQVISLYWEILIKYDVNDVCLAFTQHASNPDVGQFMPKPADIIKAIDGSGESRSMAAWTKVEKAIRTVGSYQTVVFDDAVIHKVIMDMGGWIGLNKIIDKELPFKAVEFSKRYLGYYMRSNIKYANKLIGLSEAYNSSEGHKYPDPVFIGDADKAKLIYLDGVKENVKLQVTPLLMSDKK